jgi:transcriptional regulator with XRE-family HTH domain
MVDTREKFREMLNDIAERDGIKKFTKLVELTGISANTFTNIKKNEVKEVSIETFWKLNKAFKNRYNIKWFQGDSYYMLMEDYLAAKHNHEADIRQTGDRQQEIMQRANEIQIKVLGHIIREPEKVEGMAADDDPRPNIPTWADTLLGILSKQIAENEVLHDELRQSIVEVNDIKRQIQEILNNIK